MSEITPLTVTNAEINAASGGSLPSWVSNTTVGTSAPNTAIALDSNGDIDGISFAAIESAATLTGNVVLLNDAGTQTLAGTLDMTGAMHAIGHVSSGEPGTTGQIGVWSFPTATNQLLLNAADNPGHYNATLDTSPTLGQTTQYVLSDAGNTTQYILVSNLPADNSSNLIYIDATISYDNLAAGGSQGIYVASTVTSQYKIREIFMNAGGTNFSGGNRNIIVTDNTTTYTNMPSGSLETLSDARWGDNAVPFPTGALNVPTVAGRNLVATYEGGTTDYTAGSVTLSILLQRVDLG